MKNVEITIRAYEASTDLETLSAIWFAASLLAHPFIGEERLREQRVLIETRYLPEAETFVACRAGEVVGFVSLLDNFIGGLFVAPGQQGMASAGPWSAHALKLKGELLLEVYTGNAQALRFYEALGFEELSRRAQDDEGLPFENAQLRLKA